MTLHLNHTKVLCVPNTCKASMQIFRHIGDGHTMYFLFLLFACLSDESEGEEQAKKAKGVFTLKSGRKMRRIYVVFLNAICENLTVLVALWEHIKSEYPEVKGLPTRKMQQDPLEHFFGAVRNRNGHDPRPSLYKFQCIFKKMFFGKLDVNTSGNCEALEEECEMLLAEAPQCMVELKVMDESVVGDLLIKKKKDLLENIEIWKVSELK